ncbi:RHS repeat protein [Emticicia aquatilis]|nr:RHS repeat protein [Emticicia aquatilis]
MKKILLLIMCAINVIAQTPNKFSEIPPAPNAANLGKYGEIPVNQSTGALNLNIPLLSISEGDINWPISLSYNYSGFKPMEHAGWVGRGWALNGGGVITRTVRGLADETQNFGFLAIGAEFANLLLVNPIESTVSSSPIFQNKDLGTYDTEPDIFYFNAGSLSGKFFFGQDGNPHVVTNRKIKIEKTLALSGTNPDDHSTNGIIESFTITDEAGFQYFFNVKEYSTSAMGLGSSSPWEISTWHLKHVLSPTGKKLVFNYTVGGETTIISPNFVEKGIYGGCTGCEVSVGGSNFVNDISYSFAEEKFLTSIEVSDGLSKVEFNSQIISDQFSNQTSTTRKLNSVVLKSQIDNSIIIKKNFIYNDTFSDLLASIKDESSLGTFLEPHKFEYFDGISALNLYMTKAIDHWGYYNGSNNSNTLIPEFGANRNPNFNSAKRKALKKITYPTGGSSLITYEQNEYSFTSTAFITGDLIDVENHYFAYEAAGNTFLPSTPITVNYPSNYNVTVYWEYIDETCCPNNQCSGSFLPSSGVLSPGQSYSDGYFITQSQIADLGVPCNASLHIFAYVTLNNVIGLNKKYGPGIRIKKIENVEPVRGTTESKEYFYNNSTNIDLSSGGINHSPVYTGATYLTVENSTIPFSFYRNSSILPIGSPMVIYENVDEVIGNNIRNNYTFTTYKEPYLDINSMPAVLQSNVEVIGSSENYDFSRGKLLSLKNYKNLSTLVSKTDYVYSFNKVTGIGLQNNFEYKIPSMYYESLVSITLSNAYNSISKNLFWNKFYYNVASFLEKTKETTTLYNDSDNIGVVETKEYFYEKENHLQLTKTLTTKSNGDKVEMTSKYPHDYLSIPSRASFINQLIAENRVSTPIEQFTVLEKSPTNRKVLDASVTTFKSFPGNANKATLLMPYKQFVFNRELSGVISNSYDGTTDDIISNSSYREILRFNDYNNLGKIGSVTTNKNENISYLYAYKGVYPIAEIKNSLWSAELSTAETFILNSTNSQTIQSTLDGLRTALPNNLITGYTYKSLVGVEKVISPNGLITSYNYDSFNRLKEVKDTNGKVVKSYQYNYKAQ